MSLLVKKGSFSLPTSAGNFSVTGVGFQPVAYMLFCGVDAQTVEGYTTDQWPNLGASDGTTQGTVYFHTKNAQSTSFSTFNAATTLVLSGPGNVAHVSLDSNGFTLTTSGGSGLATLIHYIAFGGSDITGVKVVNEVNITATGSHAIAGVGFQPDAAIFMAAAQSNTTDSISLGAAVSATKRWVSSASGTTGATMASSMLAKSYQRTDCVMLGAAGTTENLRIDLTSFDSGGLTLNIVTNTTVGGYDACILLLQTGGQVDVGSLAKSIAAAPVTDTITPSLPAGVSPVGALLSTFGIAATTAISPSSKFAVGATDGTNEGCMWSSETDQTIATVADSRFITTKAITISTPASTTNAESHSALTSTALTLNWTANNAVASQVLWMIFGSAASVIVASDGVTEQQLCPPFMWSMGTLQMLAECEQFDWGWKPPMTKVTMEETQYDYPPMLQSFAMSRERRQMWDEREQFDWGWKPPMTKVGFYEVMWEGTPPQMQSYFIPAIEDEQFSWGFDKSRYFSCRDEIYYEVIPSLMPNYLQVDGTSELEAITEDFVHEMVSVDLQYLFSPQLEMHYVEDDQFGFNTPVTTVQQAFDQDEGIVNQLLVFQGTSEEEAITEDFVHEMVSLDLQYTNPAWLNFMLEEEPFGFQTAVVTTTQPWDGEDNPADRAWSAKQDLDDLSFEPAIWQNPLDESNYDSFIRLTTLWQTTDEDQIQSEFFATDRVPEDYEQLVITNQLALYWNDDDASQSTFFSQEQYADNDEQFLSPYLARYQEDDVFVFQTATVTVNQPWDAEYNPGFTKLSAVDDIEQWSYEDAVQDVRDDLVEITMQSWVRAETESEQFGQNAPFLTSNSEPWEQWGQIANPPYPITHQVELDQHGQQSPFLTAQPFDETDQMGQTWWARDVDDSWSFNTPEIEGELLLEEEIEQGNQLYPLWQQIEDEQYGKQAPFITSQPFDETIDQVGQTWWARDVDDSFAFNTPELIGELLLEEELQLNNQPYPLWQQVEDEQFGKQSPFITSQPFDETIDQIGQTWWTRWQTEDEQFGQNAPFIIPFGFDFILDSYVLSPGALDDVDQFSFQPEISEDLALADEDHFVSMQFLVQEEDVFGMKAPFITSFPSDDSIDQLWNKPYPIVAEDDLVFPASTILANMLYDADFNPTMQQSYYFSSEDLEKYNWGWLPPMTKVAEDDAPYDSRAQIQSFFVPAIEDEQFSWGFDRSRFYALGDEAPYFIPAQQRTYYLPELEDEMFSWGFNQATFPALDQDELPVITAQRMYHEEDFGQQVQFYADSIGDENVTSRYIVSADEDSGMFGLTTTGFTDQLDMSPRNLWSFQEEEPFGFQQQVATAFDDSAEHFPVSARVRDDVEAFGFNPQLPTMDFTLPEERSIEWRMYGEEEIWGFAFAYADGIEQAEGVRPQQIIPTEDQPAWGTDGSAAQGVEAYPSAGRLVAIQDDYEQVAISVVQPFSFGDEIDHLPNPPFPITHQLENDQIGQQPPFIISQPFAWEESGVPSNQPWPILDVTDYNDWITNIVFKILRVYDVNIRTVLAVMAILVAQDKVLRQLENGAGYGINVIEATASLAFREVVSVPRFTAQAILGSSLSIT